jgi:integrase/recombinase XerD
VTHLRKMMLDELQRRNYSENTAKAYIRALRDFAAYYRRPPDRLGPEQISRYQLHLMREKRLAAKSVIQKMAAMKFFYVQVLGRSFRWERLPFPKNKNPLPIILSPEEVKEIIDAASDLFQRAILMTLYSTGMRCAELARLAIGDIDSKRMVVRIHRGKGGKDRLWAAAHKRSYVPENIMCRGITSISRRHQLLASAARVMLGVHCT